MGGSMAQELRGAFDLLGIAIADSPAVHIDRLDGWSDTGRQPTSYCCICWCTTDAATDHEIDTETDLAA